MSDALFYLEQDDRCEFEEYFGTDLEDMLVSGARSNIRLERYLDESEFFTFRVILTALVRDFHFPCVRFTSALALTTYMLIIETRDVSEENKEIATLELALLKKHLMEDELAQYEEGLSVIMDRWSEYVENPSSFVL